MVNSADSYKKVIDLIRQKGLIGHTFSRKETKPYRIVIKNLHHTTPHDEIVNEIEKTGNKVRGEIINARFGAEKKPSYTFFVNLEPNVNNKAIKDIQYIYHQHVKIEDPRKSKTIVQCQRCQQYGHSKNNCMRPYHCVKCGDGHKTSDCPKKDRNTPARCALCSCDHPANYKGCQVYKEIQARKNKRGDPKAQNIQNTFTNTKTDMVTMSQTILPKTSHNKDAKETYAEITKNAKNNYTLPKLSDNNHSQQTTIVEQILIKQTEKIDLLLQQISSLLSLLTAILPKLTK